MTVSNSTATFALLVHTCDRYRLLYPGFAISFKRYWDFSVPCRYYFATETINAQIDGFETIQSGKGEWADRLAYLLHEVIKEDYVIYFQEDMWLNKPVNGRFFKELFNLAVAQHWQQVKLTSSDAYVTQPAPFYIQGFQVALLDNERSGFLMSHQVTLWRREFLLQQLHKGEHPWRNERKGTKRLKKLNPEIYQVDYFAENGQPENNANPQATGRSEYQTVSMNSMLSANVLPYIQAFNRGGAAQQQYAQQLQHHYENQLTHDGLPKPRKEDFFKKVKTWWSGK
jgi:hypothetical protein